MEWGTEFDRAGTKIAFTREGAHSRNRVLHAHGGLHGPRDRAGVVPESRSPSSPSTSVNSSSPPTCCWKMAARSRRSSARSHPANCTRFAPNSVLLATGGLGTCLQQHHQSRGRNRRRCSHGVSRAGAEISDMEFVQFHPTALYLKGRSAIPPFRSARVVKALTCAMPS